MTQPIWLLKLFVLLSVKFMEMAHMRGWLTFNFIQTTYKNATLNGLKWKKKNRPIFSQNSF